MTLFLRTIYVLFLHSGDPIKEFGLHQKFCQGCKVGLTTTGVIICPNDFPSVFKFSIIFINIHANAIIS